MSTATATPNPSSPRAEFLSPRQAFERIQHISLHRDAPVADLYAPDGVHEWPFALPGDSSSTSSATSSYTRPPTPR